VQQNGARVWRDRSAVESSHNFAPVKTFKFKLAGDTVCWQRAPLSNLITLCCKRSFSDSWGRCTSCFEKSGLMDLVGRGTQGAGF